MPYKPQENDVRTTKTWDCGNPDTTIKTVSIMREGREVFNQPTTIIRGGRITMSGDSVIFNGAVIGPTITIEKFNGTEWALSKKIEPPSSSSSASADSDAKHEVSEVHAPLLTALNHMQTYLDERSAKGVDDDYITRRNDFITCKAKALASGWLPISSITRKEFFLSSNHYLERYQAIVNAAQGQSVEKVKGTFQAFIHVSSSGAGNTGSPVASVFSPTSEGTGIPAPTTGPTQTPG